MSILIFLINYTYKQTVVELYKDHGPIAEQYAVATCKYLNHLPVFP
jgi:hypothetical protein